MNEIFVNNKAYEFFIEEVVPNEIEYNTVVDGIKCSIRATLELDAIQDLKDTHDLDARAELDEIMKYILKKEVYLKLNKYATLQEFYDTATVLELVNYAKEFSMSDIPAELRDKYFDELTKAM